MKELSSTQRAPLCQSTPPLHTEETLLLSFACFWTLYKWNYTAYAFMPDFFCSWFCLWSSYRRVHVIVLCSFLLFCNVSTIIYLFYSTAVRYLCSFWLWPYEYCCYKYSCTCLLMHTYSLSLEKTVTSNQLSFVYHLTQYPWPPVDHRFQ